jgi:hypothetical protein
MTQSPSERVLEAGYPGLSRCPMRLIIAILATVSLLSGRVS